MAEYDAVLVGSGINSLVAGATLAKVGCRVCVLERNDWLGGAIKTAEITEAGFHHDVFSGWHPLFVGGAAYAELQDDLYARGLEYLNTESPTGSIPLTAKAPSSRHLGRTTSLRWTGSRRGTALLGSGQFRTSCQTRK